MSFSRGGRGHFKPVTAVLDWTHPLAQGLVACVPFTERAGAIPADLCNPSRVFTLVGTPSWLGDLFYFNGGTLSIKETMNKSITNKSYSWSFVFSNPTYSSTSTHLGIGSSGTNNNYLHWRCNAATVFEWNNFGDLGSHTVPSMTSRRCHAAGSMDTSKIQRFYFDGKFIDQRTAASLYTGDSTLAFPGNNSVLTTGLIATEHIYIWDRVLSAAEFAWLYQEPYSMFFQGWKRRYPGADVLSPFIPSIDPFEQLIVQ